MIDISTYRKKHHQQRKKNERIPTEENFYDKLSHSILRYSTETIPERDKKHLRAFYDRDYDGSPSNF
jgi:hypothetical protein